MKKKIHRQWPMLTNDITIQFFLKMDDNQIHKTVVTLVCARALHNCIIINILNIR